MMDQLMMDQLESICSLSADSSDLDLSFTSTTTASARSSLSFNNNNEPRPSAPRRRRDGSSWAAVNAATTLSADGALHLRHLKLVRPVGAGDLGRVFLCRLRGWDGGASFALKVVDKDSLTPKKLGHVQTEAQILSSLDHPFLPTLYARIEASHYTCLLMDYCPNGDLHALLRKQPRHRLPVQAVRFFAAEVLVALEYLHAQGIVYRDLKPENILIRHDGHIMLSDFDLCFQSNVSPRLETRTKPLVVGSGYAGGRRRRQREERVTEFVAEPTAAFSRSCVGTHEYLSPEMIAGGGHGNGVDWWAFGVLVYELLYGTTPFKGESKESTLRNIVARGVRFMAAAEEEAAGMGEARDLMEKLLVKDPRRRLGCVRGATDIKRHPFFDGIKWPLIRTYRSPEVRGLEVNKRRAHVSHVTGASSPRRRRCLWNKLKCRLMRRIKGSRSSLNSNSNYYSYVN